MSNVFADFFKGRRVQSVVVAMVVHGESPSYSAGAAVTTEKTSPFASLPRFDLW